MKNLLLIIFTIFLIEKLNATTDIKLQTAILLKNGIIVNAHHKEEMDVLIENGLITNLHKNIDKYPENTRIINCTGKYVLPGGIDPHVHMELPFMGTVSSDDFFTGTSAAAAGGTTLIIDFAIPGKNQSLIETYESYRKKADSKVVTDYALHMGLTDFNDKIAEEMSELVKNRGINSFKMFMAYKGALMMNDEEIYKSMVHLKNIGALSMVHAEHGELVVQGQKKMLGLGITGPEGHAYSRPDYVEAEAVHRAAALSKMAESPLYVVHVMAKAAMEEIIKAKERGQRIVGEPILSSLTLDDSVYQNKNWEEAVKYVMSPPIKSIEDQKALINGLKTGILTVIGTDHCTFKLAQKEMGRNDFTKIPNGMPGVEDRMNVLWSKLVNTGIISPEKYVDATSTQAAKIFNIYPRKGSISIDADADVIILNPKAKKTISVKTHHQNVDYNPYEGWEVTGVVETTISRGLIVYEDNKLNVVKGSGRFIPTPPFGILFEGLDKESDLYKNHKVERK